MLFCQSNIYQSTTCPKTTRSQVGGVQKKANHLFISQTCIDGLRFISLHLISQQIICVQQCKCTSVVTRRGNKRERVALTLTGDGRSPPEAEQTRTKRCKAQRNCNAKRVAVPCQFAASELGSEIALLLASLRSIVCNFKSNEFAVTQWHVAS